MKNQDRGQWVIDVNIKQSTKYWGCSYKIGTSGYPAQGSEYCRDQKRVKLQSIQRNLCTYVESHLLQCDCQCKNPSAYISLQDLSSSFQESKVLSRICYQGKETTIRGKYKWEGQSVTSCNGHIYSTTGKKIQFAGKFPFPRLFQS